MLDKESVEEFRQIWKKLYNKDLTDAEATEYANDLYELYRAVYLPVEYQDLLIK